MVRSIRLLIIRLHARHIWHAYLFVAPILLLFGAFRVVPSVQTLLYSVYRVELLRGRFTFIGLENFRELLVDPTFHQAARNTLVYVAVIVPVSAALGLLFAVLFDARFPLRELFKAVYFAPMVTSTVAAAVVWWWLYNPQFGLFNVMLRLVVYLAGLQAIPESFLEAARIDGAGAFQRFRRITLPLLAPTTSFLLIYNSIQAFQVFDQVFVLTSGGPAGSTNVIVLDLYRQAFERYNFGYASAQATFLFVLTLGVTVLQYLYSKRFEVSY
jgi:ABC-type sugar transport system permease subunit